MNIYVSSSLIKILDGLRLNLTHYYLLTLSYLGKFEEGISPVHEQTLTRKGYLKDRNLTEEGEILYNQLKVEAEKDKPAKSAEVVKKIKTKITRVRNSYNESFETWWKTYPTTPEWIDDSGVKWEGERMLKQLKHKCYQMFLDCVADGWKAEELVELLELEIEARKKETLRTRENKLMYMQLTTTYLNQRTFEGWKEKKDSGIIQGTPKKKPVDTTTFF